MFNYPSLQRQTYLRLSLVSANEDVCKLEPGNVHVGLHNLAQVAPDLLHKVFTERSSPVSFYDNHRIWLAKEKQKAFMSQNSFPGLGLQMLFSVGQPSMVHVLPVIFFFRVDRPRPPLSRTKESHESRNLTCLLGKSFWNMLSAEWNCKLKERSFNLS